MVANLRIRGYHCKELPVPKVGTHGTQPGNQRLPLQGTAGSQRLELMVANLGTRGWNCRFPKVGTHGSQPENHRLPLQGIAGSQRLELMATNLGPRGYHCKELPVPRGWNSRAPTWEPEVTIVRNSRFPKVETHGSQPEKQYFTSARNC